MKAAGGLTPAGDGEPVGSIIAKCRTCATWKRMELYIAPSVVDRSGSTIRTETNVQRANAPTPMAKWPAMSERVFCRRDREMPDTNEEAEQCQATNATGGPCGAKPQPGRSLCLWHDPQEAERRHQMSSKGGKARSNKARARKALPADPLSTEELHAWLGVVFKGVIAGKIEPGVATASATVARTMAELSKTDELEQRITNLEAERDRRRLG